MNLFSLLVPLSVVLTLTSGQNCCAPTVIQLSCNEGRQRPPPPPPPPECPTPPPVTTEEPQTVEAETTMSSETQTIETETLMPPEEPQTVEAETTMPSETQTVETETLMPPEEPQTVEAETTMPSETQTVETETLMPPDEPQTVETETLMPTNEPQTAQSESQFKAYREFRRGPGCWHTWVENVYYEPLPDKEHYHNLPPGLRFEKHNGEWKPVNTGGYQLPPKNWDHQPETLGFPLPEKGTPHYNMLVCWVSEDGSRHGDGKLP